MAESATVAKRMRIRSAGIARWRLPQGGVVMVAGMEKLDQIRDNIIHLDGVDPSPFMAANLFLLAVGTVLLFLVLTRGE